jgi:hypothetical protein
MAIAIPSKVAAPGFIVPPKGPFPPNFPQSAAGRNSLGGSEEAGSVLV